MLDEVFPSTSCSRHAVKRGHHSNVSQDKLSSKYLASYQAAEMRRGILSNELEDAIAEMEVVQKKSHNLSAGNMHVTTVCNMWMT